MALKIDKGIPLPDTNPSGATGLSGDIRELFTKGDVGDSAFFPCPQGRTPTQFSATMTSTIANVASRCMSQRRVKEDNVEGIRVWKRFNSTDEALKANNETPAVALNDVLDASPEEQARLAEAGVGSSSAGA